MAANDNLNLKQILIGNRIPQDFFITTGSGESDIAIHAGSYHLALKNAGIEAYNIMTYSSILPAISIKIDKPKILPHGSVVESIMAVVHLKKGKSGSAGIIYGQLYDKKTKEKYGGLVCEHGGEMTEKQIAAQLKASLQELYVNGFSEQFDLKDIELTTKIFTARKKYGTALVAICFTSYLVPLINNE